MLIFRYFKKINLFNFMLPILIILLIALYLIGSYHRSFDETSFDIDKIYGHIEELSSPKYNGRMVGSPGNELALQYVEDYFNELGIETAGENDTYYQHFETMIPEVDPDPYFAIRNKEGEVVEEFEMYKNYKLFTYWYGGGGRFKGDILFVDKYMYHVPVELFKDKVVVMGAYDIRIKDVEHVLEHGSKGILFRRISEFDRDDKNLHLQKKIQYDAKKGRSLFFGYLGAETYSKMKKHADYELMYKELPKDKSKEKIPETVGIIKDVTLKCDINYPVIKSANFLGKITGKREDEYLIIGANIDHVGSGMDGKYFPGALNNASGTGMVLELARLIKAQRNLPDKTIIFALWNARENVATGSRYYVDNPMYPLEKTELINLDAVGNRKDGKIIFQSDEKIGRILRNKIFQYSEDLKNNEELKIQPTEVEVSGWGNHMPFIEEKVPAVNITDGYLNAYTYMDTIDNVGKEKVEKIGLVLVNYIKRDIFKDTFPDYLNGIELFLITSFLIIVMGIYIIFSLNKTDPNLKVLNTTVENIYYSSPFNILLKCFYFITPVFIVLVSLIFIANLPPNFNIIFHNDKSHMNLSIYLTLKNSVLYIRNLLLNGLGETSNHVEIFPIVSAAVIRSLKLISVTIIISLVFGILKGMFDSYRGGTKGDLRTVGTLMAFSLPDVFIVLCGMLAITYISNNDTLKQLIDLSSFRNFVMPLLVLSVIPSVYISRITFIVVQEEIKKGYVRAAKSKGLSKFQIFTKHIFNCVILKVIDSVPTLITIIISNLIVVEYLLNYKGIVYNLYRFYQSNDVNSFIGCSIALGLIYITFIMMSKLISKLINPMKREGVR